ncbi:MAG: sigma-70 family RNA polymerase sigma factor [Planctomycetota bacterium]
MTERPEPPPSTFELAQSGAPVLERLVEENLPRLRAFVRAHLSPEVRVRESAGDIVQTVCRALLAGRSGFDFRGEVEFRAWLFTAARRKILEKYRFHHAEQRDLRREAEPVEDAGLARGYASICTPSQAVAASEQIEQLERAMDSLDEEHREVIALARLAELPLPEVGARMDRSADAARKLLGRALVKLADALARDQAGG